jgi:gas vesicle protein
MKFFLGFAIGVALGTVFAPASGEETRRWLKRKAEDASRLPKRKMREAADATREKAGDMGARIGRQAAESAVQAVENKVVGDTGTD